MRAMIPTVSTFIAVLSCCIPLLGSFQEDSAVIRVHRDEPLRYVIVVTGGELLKGVYPDLHTEFITRTLRPLGVDCVASISVGDDRTDVLDALAFGRERAPLVIVTGGLGPTDDDLTRQALSDFSGVPLKENETLLATLESRFSTSRSGLRENIRRQALTPVTGRYFHNPNGTASGIVFESDSTVFVALPGPPGELRPMVIRDLIPYLSERFGTRGLGASLQMRFVGIGESSIDAAIHDHLDLPPDLMISSLFEAGRVDLTFSLPGSGEDEMARLKALETELKSHIGEYLYASDGSSLEKHVVELLTRAGVTLGTAEVGSRGAVFAGLAEEAEPSRVVQGGFVASDDTRMISLLSRRGASDPAGSGGEPPEPEMIARIVRTVLNTDWGLAVSEVKASPGKPLGFVWVSFGNSEHGLTTKKVFLRGEGSEGRDRLVTSILDALRKRLRSMLGAGHRRDF